VAARAVANYEARRRSAILGIGKVQGRGEFEIGLQAPCAG
jgi:hypothetical protein